MNDIHLTLDVEVKMDKKSNPDQRIDVATGVTEEMGTKFIDDFIKAMYKNNGNGFQSLYELTKDHPKAGNIVFTLAMSFLNTMFLENRAREKANQNMQTILKNAKENTCPQWQTGTTCDKCFMNSTCKKPYKANPGEQYGSPEEQ